MQAYCDSRNIEIIKLLVIIVHRTILKYIEPRAVKIEFNLFTLFLLILNIQTKNLKYFFLSFV